MLGAGSWGTALAMLTARIGRSVLLWTHDDKRRLTPLCGNDTSGQLPGALTLPENIKVTSHFEQLIEHSSDFVVAVCNHGRSRWSVPSSECIRIARTRVAQTGF